MFAGSSAMAMSGSGRLARNGSRTGWENGRREVGRGVRVAVDEEVEIVEPTVVEPSMVEPLREAMSESSSGVGSVKAVWVPVSEGKERVVEQRLATDSESLVNVS